MSSSLESTAWVSLGSAKHTDFRGSMRISENLTVGAGGNGVVKVRHVDGKHWENDTDEALFLNWNTGKDVYVGGEKPAALRVTGDLTVGAGGNGVVKVRHVDGKHFENDTDDGLFLNWNTGQNVHVGGEKRASLVLTGDLTVGAGSNGSIRVRHIDGKHWQNDSLDTLHLNYDTGKLVIVGRFDGGPQKRADLRVTSDLVVDGGDGNPIPGFPHWSGGGIVTWDLFAGGTLECPNKRFAIDHPADPARRRLVHASLEGPEAGVYYRGEAALEDGEATIELPGYFEALARSDNRTVLVTPKFDGDEPVSALAVSEIDDGVFRVRAIEGANPSQAFYWEVKAVRADIDPLEVEPLKLVPDAVPA